MDKTQPVKNAFKTENQNKSSATKHDPGVQLKRLSELVHTLQGKLSTAAQTARAIKDDRDRVCINLLQEIEKQTPRPLNKDAMYLLLYGIFYPYSTLIICDLINSKKLACRFCVFSIWFFSNVPREFVAATKAVIDVIALRKKYVPDGLTVPAIVTFLLKGAPKLTFNVISEAKASCSHLLELLVLHESADSADAILQLLEKTQTAQPQALDLSLNYMAVWKLYLNPLVIKSITPALGSAINLFEFAWEGKGVLHVEWSDGREEDYSDGKVFRRNNGLSLISALLWPSQHSHQIEQRVQEILSVMENYDNQSSEFMTKALGDLLETAATNADSKRNMPAGSELWFWRELCVQHGHIVLTATPKLLHRVLAVALACRAQFVQEGLASLFAHACDLLRQGQNIGEEIKFFCQNLCHHIQLESCPADQFLAFLVDQLSVVIIQQRVTIQLPFTVLVKYLDYYLAASSNKDVSEETLRILVTWFAQSRTDPLLSILLPFYNTCPPKLPQGGKSAKV